MTQGDLSGLLSYVNAQQSETRPHGSESRGAPVVTIAADHGAGGPEIAAEIGRRLGVACFDKRLLDGAIKEARGDPGLMRRLDEELPLRPGTGFYAALLGIDDPLEEYRRLMARVVNGIAARGGVILGRGAHLLVRGDRSLRVRLVGSPEVCGRRIAGGDARAFETKRAEAERINADKAAFLRTCWNVDRDDARLFDLILNTDRLADLSVVPDLIVRALDAATGAVNRDPHQTPRAA